MANPLTVNVTFNADEVRKMVEERLPHIKNIIALMRVFAVGSDDKDVRVTATRALDIWYGTSNWPDGEYPIPAPNTPDTPIIRAIVEEIADETCERHELNGERRYWCGTHREYGREEGCLGERARRALGRLEG